MFSWDRVSCEEQSMFVNVDYKEEGQQIHLHYVIQFDVPTHCYQAKVLKVVPDLKKDHLSIFVLVTSKMGLCAQSFKRITLVNTLSIKSATYNTTDVYVVNSENETLSFYSFPILNK